MSDEEDDYMSDKYLSGIADVRPSLIQNRARKRELAVADQQRQLQKRQRDEKLERKGTNLNARLQESLRRPIEEGNKGFQMLAKMGYKPGQALGKMLPTTASYSERNKPLTEPIGINIKSDRFGLGRETALRELAETRLKLRKQRLHKISGTEISTEEFRKRSTQKAEDRFVFHALKRCQLTCENLDTKFNIEEPEMIWFWPERLPDAAKTDDDQSEDDLKDDPKCLDEESANNDVDEYTNAEKLEMLINYLRTSYQFCFWCGVHYADEYDLNTNCPGLTRDDH